MDLFLKRSLGAGMALLLCVVGSVASGSGGAPVATGEGFARLRLKGELRTAVSIGAGFSQVGTGTEEKLAALLTVTQALAPLVKENLPITGLFGQASGLEVLGFVTDYGSGASAQDALTHVGELTTVSPLWFQVTGSGTVEGSGKSGLTSAVTDQGKKVLPIVTNQGYAMLLNDSLRMTAAQNLLRLAEQNGYNGVNMDFEGLPASTRGDFTTFVEDVASLFHIHGLEVTVDVGPKISSDPADNPAGMAYDYAALGASADRVVLMTYDLHGPGTLPGPISSPSWDEAVLQYALTRIPAQKILLGIAAYGYDWGRGSVQSVSDSEAHALASSMGATIAWSAAAGEPYFTYTDANGVSHSVWWDNSYALSLRLNLVRQYGIDGIAVWRLGDEGVRFWQVLDNAKG